MKGGLPMTGFQCALKMSGMTQTQLAEKTGLSRSFINDLYKNRRAPSLEIAERLLKELNATPAVAESCVNDWRPELRLWLRLANR